jgi:hypothetical protein
VKEVERLGVVEQNTSCRWASAPHSVSTSNAEGDRLTADLRQVHQRTEPMVWPTTDVESCAHRLAASTCYATVDLSNCVWPLALDEDAQECQSFVAPDGVYPPRQVLHGQVSATTCTQAAVRIMFQGLADKLLCWLDDLQLHCMDVDSLLALSIGNFRQRIGRPRRQAWPRQNGSSLTRGPTVRTCGVQGRSQARPELCVYLGGHEAAGDGWRLAGACVRPAVPSYAQEMSTLAELLDEVYKRAGGQTGKRAAKVKTLRPDTRRMTESMFDPSRCWQVQ